MSVVKIIDFTFEETLERERHMVFTSDMSEQTMKALAHHKNVIKALEKQVPKKPIWEGDGYSDGEMVYDTWYCSNCDSDFEENERHLFCPVCGQAIDWSEK